MLQVGEDDVLLSVLKSMLLGKYFFAVLILSAGQRRCLGGARRRS